MSSSYRNTLNSYLSSLELSCGTLLDIGGSQIGLRERVAKCEVDRYLVADLPDPHEDSAKPDVCLDLNRAFDAYDNVNDDAYRLRYEVDIVTCFEVFEYVYDPARAMRTIAHLLKDQDSRAYISFPSVYPVHQPIEDDALRYMPGGVKKLALQAGLEIVDIFWRRPETRLFDQFFHAERMRAARSVDHNFIGMIVTFRPQTASNIS